MSEVKVNYPMSISRVMRISKVPHCTVFMGTIKGFEDSGRLFKRAGSFIIPLEKWGYFRADNFDVVNKDFEILDYQEVDLEIMVIPKK